MHNTRPARAWTAAVGLAVTAVLLTACGGATDSAADAVTSPGTGSSSAGANGDEGAVNGGSGDAAGIIESGSGEADPELVGAPGESDGSIGAQLAGKTYGVHSATGLTFVDPSTMQFVFPAANHISIIGGCNTQFGELVWDGANVAAPALASTMMACDQPLMDQDQALSALLAEGVTATLDGDTLTLAAADVKIELVDQHIPVDQNGETGDLEQPIPSPGETPANPGD